MKEPTTTTYALLGLLAIQPWTGYELTNQARRSLRYGWPSSEAHLYREQKLLVALGWATEREEQAGKRTRKRYRITAAGRRAFRDWLDTEPQPPKIEAEGILRVFFADHGSRDSLLKTLQTTSEQARESLDAIAGLVAEYLDGGGPFPERIHVIAMASDVITDILARIAEFASEASEQVAAWDTTKDLGLTDDARERILRCVERANRLQETR